VGGERRDMGGMGRGAKLSGKDDNKEQFKKCAKLYKFNKGILQELRYFFKKVPYKIFS
jgi:hypothetical protein